MFQIANNTIKITRGDSGEIDLTIYDTDGSEYELKDGDEVLFTVKESTLSPNALIQKSGTKISILPEDTKNLSYRKYVFDVQLTTATGTVDTIIPPSTFEVLSEVTF